MPSAATIMITAVPNAVSQKTNALSAGGFGVRQQASEIQIDLIFQIRLAPRNGGAQFHGPLTTT
jgi:hypothetical protein